MQTTHHTLELTWLICVVLQDNTCELKMHIVIHKYTIVSIPSFTQHEQITQATAVMHFKASIRP